jgi:hypothetical protein
MSAEMITKAWKGFDKNFRCLTQQYAVGDVCELDGDPIICRRGFHACTTPIDVLAYYPAATSRYAEVELIGQTVAEENSDSKRAASKIRIVREISYFELWQAQRAWAAKQKLEAAATGDRGHAAATGDRGHAAATGDSGHAAATGKNAIAASLGINGTAQATIGNWIVLAAYNDDGDLLQVRTAKCGDGEGELKPGQYRLDETGAFVLCDKEVE